MKLSTYKGSDLPRSYKSYARRHIRNLQDIGLNVVRASIGFYFWTVFIQTDKGLFYLSESDARRFPDNDWLIRTAKHDRDYTGGTNCYVTPNAASVLKFIQG